MKIVNKTTWRAKRERAAGEQKHALVASQAIERTEMVALVPHAIIMHGGIILNGSTLKRRKSGLE
jgi:hypothetical protein